MSPLIGATMFVARSGPGYTLWLSYEDYTGLAGEPGTRLPALRVFPNPASTRATLALDRPAPTVRLFDALGRVVAERPAAGASVELDVSGLSAGVYVVQAGTATARLVVRR